MSVIKVEQLKKVFKGKEVVKGISFELNKGRCVALLGPNGAGKTTTLRMLSGLLKPSNGSIKFQEKNALNDIRYSIGYLPQYPVFHSWMSGKEFLMYVGELAYLSKKEANERAEELLKKVAIDDAKNQRISKYSGGMKQRLGIAQAMMHKPKLLMLDEPVSSLDPIGRREVLTLMEELKEETTILFSTHILGDAEEICDDLLLLHHGEILESGSIDDLRKRHQSPKFELSLRDSANKYVDKIERLESVNTIVLEKGELHIFVNDIARARAEILTKAVQEDWPIVKFELSRTSLEDLFMKVVQS
ncbi:ABC transporter ATP-binding protein [Gracilibacillus dipsosauri]|uniref:ABC transporter ATP-binding protein n=1 Tax=Gracilibacillus dipsosauri TaxID=178340 RepID=A0A317KU60_9BACI|nr:ABC transporter ATP-binding protein [Gracilibacillus dipsosauri]PWU66856.1 ABC transporter ATP-binding protein [Gracilibacillus dipsosauri]